MSLAKIGILGTGTMGKQIALLCASHNVPVMVWNHVMRDGFEGDLRKIAALQSRLGTIGKERIDSILGNIACVRSLLADFYRPHNERLFQFLGVRYGWQ